jgi:Acetoacetate decarboxylase (ADC)
MNTTLSNGETLSFPIVTRDVTQFIVAYPVRVSDVNRLLPNDLRAFDSGYGLTHMALYWLQAGDSDFGGFSEVSVNFAVCEPYYRSQAFHYHANPVSTERARCTGYEVWGNPTTLAQVEIATSGATVGCTLNQDAQFVLSLSATPATGTPWSTNGLLSAASDFSQRKQSSIYRYAQSARLCKREDQPAHVKLELGQHPLSQLLGGLLLDDRPLYSIFMTGSTILSGPRFSELFKLLH